MRKKKKTKTNVATRIELREVKWYDVTEEYKGDGHPRNGYVALYTKEDGWTMFEPVRPAKGKSKK